MFSKQSIGIRLVEERARLGYSQASIAHQTGKSRQQYINYETGQSELTAGFLAQASQLGIDIQYVVTGVKSINMSEVTGHLDNSSHKNNELDKDTANASITNIQGKVANSVFAGAGSTINQINTQQHITRTKAEVKAGDEHVSDEQKATLQRLVGEIVELETKYRTAKSAKSHRAVWASLNKHLKVTSYHLIPIDKYDTAQTYLRKWIGRLNSLKTAQKTDNDAWRKRKYSYIQTNLKKFDLDVWYREYLRDNFDVKSSTELTDEQLEQTYHAVAYQVRKNKWK